MAKTPAKKVSAKKAAPKKAAAKKVTAKKAVAKKVSAKKAVAEKNPKIVSIMDPATLLAITVAQGMYEKKAENIRIWDMRKIASAPADFFVISSADNDKKVEAIAKSVEDEVKKKLNENPLHREGYENLEWILVDYFNVVAHVFQEEKREFYGIEQLWGDAIEVPFKGK
jgi:ribosome-associated protein